MENIELESEESYKVPNLEKGIAVLELYQNYRLE